LFVSWIRQFWFTASSNLSTSIHLPIAIKRNSEDTRPSVARIHFRYKHVIEMIIYVSVVFVLSLSLCTVSRSFKSVKTVVNENYLPLWVKLKCFSTIQIWKITWYYSWNSKSSNHKLCMVNWFPQWHNLHLNSLNVNKNQGIAYVQKLFHIRLDLQLPVQTVPITTDVVRSNPVHGQVYPI
jgi:hypothetical protein